MSSRIGPFPVRVSAAVDVPEPGFVLTEDGFNLLLETGDFLMTEG